MEQTIQELQENLKKRSNDIESLNKELEERNDEIERLHNEQRIIKKKLMQYWKILSARIDAEEFEEILNMNVDSDPTDIIDALMILQEAYQEKEISNQLLIKDLEDQLNRRNTENNSQELERHIEMIKSLNEKDQLGFTKLYEQQQEMIKKLTQIEFFEQKIAQLDNQIKSHQQDSNQQIASLNEEMDNLRQKEMDLRLKYKQKVEENEKQQQLIESLLKTKLQKQLQLSDSNQKDQLSQNSYQSRKGINHSENPSPQVLKKDLKFTSLHSHRPKLSSLIDQKLQSHIKLQSFELREQTPKIVQGSHLNDFKPFGLKKV